MGELALLVVEGEAIGWEARCEPALRTEAQLRQARQVLPGLEASDFSIWIGFRPSFPDSLPVIDEAPGRRGLFLAFGHGHTGMTGGAPTGRLVKQLVAGEPADVPLAPYSARRFH